MNTIQKISKNIGLIVISQILTYVLAFFTVIYTARYLGADGFGIISLALSIGAIFGVFVDMGISTLMVRELARDKSLSNKYISNSILMKILLSFITFCLVVLTVKIIGYNQIESIVIYVITISVILTSFFGLLNSLFQANEKMEYLAMANIINSAVLLLFTIIGIFYGLSIIYFAGIYVFTSTIVLIYCLIVYLLKFSNIKFEFDLSFWKPTLKESWSFGIIFLSGMLYTYIDSIMLSILKTTEAVGWYSAAYRLMYIALLLPNAINIVIFPVMSRMYSNSSKNSLNLLNERYFKYMIIVGIPLGFGTTLLAKQVILLLYGNVYIPSIISLQILVWAIVLTFAGASYTQLLQSTNKQLIITKISIACLIINIILNLILIPPYSYIGASFATFITEAVLVGYIIFITYKLGYGISYKIVLKDLIKVLFATSIMSIFIWYFNSLNFFLVLIVAIIIYFITLYIVRGIDDVDIEILKEIRG
ncbi:flippase [Methanobacterium sp. SMA-27]|uniref:flippase n=1 Tax=Methanobacterium sp. SMA-27 TaxID=1495336 RepID=UPI00064EC140|nr:flippase [Methanobacterium sp. SMA-27]